MTTSPVLISSGGLAKRFGVSVELIQKLDRAGKIVPSVLIEGSGRRAWLGEDIPTIERQITERKSAGRWPATEAA
jgi:hypothetical protein